MVNLSLDAGQIQDICKSGQLKKDYRAVSNLTFLSRVTEKVGDQQLSHHMSSFQLYSEFQ